MPEKFLLGLTTGLVDNHGRKENEPQSCEPIEIQNHIRVGFPVIVCFRKENIVWQWQNQHTDVFNSMVSHDQLACMLQKKLDWIQAEKLKSVNCMQKH